MLHEALQVGSGSVPKSYWNRGVEAQTLFSLLTFAWLRCAVVARHKNRGAILTSFQFFAVRHVSKPAAAKFTLRMGLFAIVQLSYTI